MGGGRGGGVGGGLRGLKREMLEAVLYFGLSACFGQGIC